MSKLPRFFTLPVITLQSFALPILAGTLALTAWGQGAIHPGMSIYAEPSYDGVEREVLNPKTNTWDSQRGYLMFDAREQVRFINNSGNQFKIPYKAIRALEFSFYNPVEVKKAKGPAFNVKLGGKRYLTVRYDQGSGMESAVIAIDPDQYQQVLGSFRSKTNIPVMRPGGYEKRW